MDVIGCDVGDEYGGRVVCRREGDCAGVMEGSTIGSTLGSDEGAAVIDADEGAEDAGGATGLKA